MSDNVNHPSHYKQGAVECIDALKAALTHEEYIGFLKGNAFKYVWRSNNKGKPVEDMQKARWYIDKWIEEETCSCTETKQRSAKHL